MLHILQLDNGPLHTAKKLQVPPNIVLLFQPSHSPELNPIESLWQHLLGQLKWEVFKKLSLKKGKVSGKDSPVPLNIEEKYKSLIYIS